jgi:magnesium chelatase family protein
MNFLHDQLEKELLTARGLHKIIRLSWTLADLAGHTIPNLADVQRAHQLREGSEL